MPKSVMLPVLTKTRLSRLRKWDQADAQQYLDEILLVDEAGMKKLFPGASIYKERMLGLVKSLTAHNLI